MRTRATGIAEAETDIGLVLRRLDDLWDWRAVVGHHTLEICGRSGSKGLASAGLASLLKTYEGIPYVDCGHYAPRANKLIAGEIFRCVFARI